MKRIILIAGSFFLCFNSYGQTDTLVRKQQKGFLFLTNYNYQYDYNGAEIKSLGFHDFFFPSDSMDPKCFLDSNLNITLRNGVRVDFINNRRPLKDKALIFSCIDTSHCYDFDKFHIIPVTMDYKMFDDYEPFVCRRNYFEIQVVNGSRLRFDYLHKAVIPIRIASVASR